MNIKIDETVATLVPDEFKSLSADDLFSLTKTEDLRKGFQFVVSGDRVIGKLSIVNVIGKPGVKVQNLSYGGGDLEIPYIRTSPIVKVLDATADIITFQTEGGVYKLERVKNA